MINFRCERYEHQMLMITRNGDKNNNDNDDINDDLAATWLNYLNNDSQNYHYQIDTIV